MSKWEPWTLVLTGTSTPVVPFDCNEHDDEGMLVYRSEGAASKAAEHQLNLYGVECVAARLSEVIDAEADTPATEKARAEQ